jgi:hypothetical protein
MIRSDPPRAGAGGPVAIFSSSPFAFGVTAKLSHGLGEVDVRRLDRDLVVDEHVARDDVLELRHRAEIADAERVDGLGVLALQKSTWPSAPSQRARVDERRVARDRPGEDAEAADAARERVGDRLEDEDGLLRVAELDRGALLRRRRDALHEQVEERGRAEVLRRDAAGDRVELVARHRRLERVGDRLRIELLPLEIAPHELLVRLDDRVEELLAVLLHEVGHRVGDRLRPALASTGRIHVGTHVEEVDDSVSSCSLPIGSWIATQRSESCCRAASSTRKKSARSRSSMLTKRTRESSCCSARCHTRAVLTSTPSRR